MSRNHAATRKLRSTLRWATASSALAVDQPVEIHYIKIAKYRIGAHDSSRNATTKGEARMLRANAFLRVRPTWVACATLGFFWPSLVAAQTIARLSADATTIAPGTEANIQVDLDASGEALRCGLEIHFGDGSSKKLRLSRDGDIKELPVRIAHRYDRAGQYEVQVEGKMVTHGFGTVGSCSGKAQSLKLTVGEAGVAAAESAPVTTGEAPTAAPNPLPAAQSEPATLQKLDTCMKQRMLAGGVIGALVGGAVGATAGNSGRKTKTGVIGAGAGAAIGAAIAWKGAYKACTDKLRLATLSSRQTADYKATAQRYKYHGGQPLLKIEDVGVPQKVVAGQVMPADLRYALLTPDAGEADVTVVRAFKCGSTDIPIQQERYQQGPGTVVSTGKILIPTMGKEIGDQPCTMLLAVSAAGTRDEVTRNFVISPQ